MIPEHSTTALCNEVGVDFSEKVGGKSKAKQSTLKTILQSGCKSRMDTHQWEAVSGTNGLTGHRYLGKKKGHSND